MSPAVQELIQLSRTIGQEISLVQGGGGNTSVKADDLLYIKASGTPLKDMSAEHGWVILNDQTTTERPSMEWPMHQALQAPWVCHTHSVYLNVFGCMKSGGEQLDKILAHMPHTILPYTQPGQALARAIQQLPTQPEVIILKNHGLLIATNTAERALALTQDIHERCARLMPRPFAVLAELLPSEHYYFPDAVVLSTNPAVVSANSYIAEMIELLGGMAKALTNDEVTALRDMEEEQYRIRLNS